MVDVIEKSDPSRILHVISGLHPGGAELTLKRLISEWSDLGFQHIVVSLTDIGSIGRSLISNGIPVTSLQMQRKLFALGGLFRLRKLVYSLQPALIQTWMYPSDLLGGLVARITHRIPVVWNIRQTRLDRKHHKLLTYLARWVCAKSSTILPSRIVCNSKSAMQSHEEVGYGSDKMVLIPNGFDLTIFHPDQEARRELREELNVPENTPMIGMVARYDPLKDHQTFAQAAGILRRSRPEIRFLLAGQGVDWSNRCLLEWLEKQHIVENCILVGHRDDVARVHAAVDIATLSSLSEGMPNVIGEAMACGVPCVATDVGDTRELIGEAGRLVPPRDPEALAEAWLEILTLAPAERAAIGALGRDQIAQNYSIQTMISRYRDLYRELSDVRNHRIS